MKEFFILLLAAGFIILTIKIFKSKQNLMLKLLFCLISLAAFYIIFLFLMSTIWENGRKPKLEDEGFELPIKSIYFINDKNEPIRIILDFKYTEKENIKSNINLQYNKIDTIYLDKLKSIGSQTPILFKDTIIKFPQKFSIRIIDSTGNIVKTYNKEDFFNSIEKSKYTNRNDIESKQTSWTLKIK
jgi:hypothetical protein